MKNQTVFSVRIHVKDGSFMDTLLFASEESAMKHARRIQNAPNVLGIVRIEILKQEIHP